MPVHRSAIEWMVMNKWFYRAVGVASGALLLSGGTAHAGAAHESKVDPQAMRGLLADLFTPTGGQHHLGLSIDKPTNIFSTRTPAGKDLANTHVMPDLTTVMPSSDLLSANESRRELLPALGLIPGA